MRSTPGEKLGDDAGLQATRDSLGDYDVSFYVLMQPIFDLVESTGAASDADWQKAKPYLEPLSALVAGHVRRGRRPEVGFQAGREVAAG